MAGFNLFVDQAKENRLQLLGVINLCIGSLLLVICSLKTIPRYFPDSSELVLEAPKKEFCNLAMNQMIQKKLSPHFIKEGLYELVTKNRYEALLLEGNETISGIWTDEKTCKVLLKNSSGLRSFDFFLDGSTNHKFFYQIQKIRENELFAGRGE